MKIESHRSSEKQAQMLKLLQFGTVMVFLDSRHPDVQVPAYLREDFQLRLNFDYAYEIDDFRILPDRLEASLSFHKKDFFCVVPFSAVYLMLSHSIKHGALFAETVPDEMLDFFEREARLYAAEPDVEDMPENALFENQSSVLTGTESVSSAATVQKRHLRLVKS